MTDQTELESLSDEAILAQMDEQEPTEVETKLEEPVIKDLTKKQVYAMMEQINGLGMQFGDLFFRVNYINKGQCRFTADLVNRVVDSRTVDYTTKSSDEAESDAG